MSRFELGRVVATPGALESLGDGDVATLIAWHLALLPGTLSAEDVRANESAVEHGEARIFSAFKLEGIVYWVITEADRASTTILLPDE